MAVWAALLLTLTLAGAAHSEETSVLYEQYDTSTYTPGQVNWGIKEGKYGYGWCHSASNGILCAFDDASARINLPEGQTLDASYLKEDFAVAMALWRGAAFNTGEELLPFDIDFARADQAPSVYARVIYDPNDVRSAYVDNKNAVLFPGTAHYQRVSIIINAFYLRGETDEQRARNAHILCHELGHVIGLVDLDGYAKASQSPYLFSDVLMGYGWDRSFYGPTDADIKGAAVILGIHRNEDHVFGAPVPSADSHNEHRLVCGLCDGYRLEPHDYTLTGGKAVCACGAQLSGLTYIHFSWLYS